MKYIMLLLALSACYKLPNWAKPDGTMIARTMPKGGSHAFELGWNHGCQSGMATFTHDFVRSFYGFQKDIRFEGYRYGDDRDLFEGHSITDAEKSEYSTGWSRAYGICKHHILGINKPGMMPYIPGFQPYGQLHGIDNIYELNAWGSGGATAYNKGWFANW